MRAELAKELLGMILADNTQTSSTENDAANYVQAVFQLGKIYMIRTVTMIDVGRVVAVTPQFIVLEEAAWVADTGRFHEALKDPSVLKEVEPFPGQCIVGVGAIVDACEYPVTLRQPK